MPDIPLISNEEILPKELTDEEKKKRDTISDCTTMILSILTRSSYLIQLDQIRLIFILDDRVRTRIDDIIIDETEEILEDIYALSPCEFFDYVDPTELENLLDELGNLDVNKAKQYGEHAWDMFSKIIIDYVVNTWKY